MFQYSDIPWPFVYLPLMADLSDDGGNSFTITHQGTGAADFTTRTGWLTLNGTDNYIDFANSAALVEMFTVGSGSALFMCNINIAQPLTTGDTILSCPGGVSAGNCKGITLDAYTTGVARLYLDAQTSWPISAADIIADGTDHTLVILFDAANNNVILWVDGVLGESGRNMMAMQPGDIPTLEFVLDSGSVTYIPRVLLGARLRTNGVTIDQFSPMQIKRFGWINFGSEEISHIQLNKMARDYNQNGLRGSNFT